MSGPQKNSLSIHSRRIAVGLLILGLLLAFLGLWFILAYASPFLVITVFVASLIAFFLALLVLKANPVILAALVGLCLALLSFAFQPLGPEIRQWGTECVPLADCFAPVRGAGFPIQYLVDFPGVTSPGDLGFEDEFRIWAFIIDFGFFSALALLAHRLGRYFLKRKITFTATTG